MSRITGSSSMRARFLLLAFLAGAVSCRSTYSFPGFEGGLGRPVPTPVDVDAVVFLVGDAGAAVTGQSPLLSRLRSDVEYWSRELGRDSAVSVAFMGDNVYPYGVHEPGHPSFRQDSARLWSQIDVLGGEAAQRYHSVGLFVPGNHDWSPSGGVESPGRLINEQNLLIQARETGPRVALLPPAGEPGPIVRDLRDRVRLVFFDSEWFLLEPAEAARTKFMDGLRDALKTAGDRKVVLLSHHPFASAGPHGVLTGGPATAGALYLLSKSGSLVQDLNSPAYGSLRTRMSAAFESTGKIPLVYAAGHDHSLQVLSGTRTGDPPTMLVSGSASKLSAISDTAGMRYGAVKPGYMMLLFRYDGTVDLFVTAGDPAYQICPPSPDDARAACMANGIRSFDVTYSETLPETPEAAAARSRAIEAAGGPKATDEKEVGIEERLDSVDAPPRAVADSVHAERSDSVIASPGRSFNAGSIGRLVRGSLNRDLWDIEFSAAVLDLRMYAGGLTPVGLSGTDDAPCLQLQGADGRIYEFRPIVENASSSMPDLLQSGAADGAQDDLGARFPLGTGLAAALMDAADVLVTTPELVVLPDDPALGKFAEVFAGRMGWLAAAPDVDSRVAGKFAGALRIENTRALLDSLRVRPGTRVDLAAYLRARLVDLYVNDWNSDARTWRWAVFPDTVGNLWKPIPGQCAWAFTRVDGAVPRIAGAIYPEFTGFGENYADIARSVRAGSVLDQRLLGGVDRGLFLAQAAALKEAFSDAVIDSALQVLPHEYLEVEEARLRTALRSRRDQLSVIAEQYYRLIAQTADVYGTLASDSMHLTVGSYSVTMTMMRGEERVPAFTRTFRRGETDEVRVYLLAGSDVVTVSGSSRLPVKLRLIGEPAAVQLVQPLGSELLVHEGDVSEDRNGSLTFHRSDDGAEPADSTREGVAAADPVSPVPVWEPRDRGTQWLISPAVSYKSEFGANLGVKISRLDFGFRKVPWESRLTVQAVAGVTPLRSVVKASYERRIGLHGFAGKVELEGYTLQRSRFFGLGNGSEIGASSSFYTALRPHVQTDASLLYRSPGETWAVWIGPRFLYWGSSQASGDSLILDRGNAVYGGDAFTAIGLQAGLEIDARDDIDLPTAGSLTRIEMRAFPVTGGLRQSWTGTQATFQGYWDVPGPLDPVLGLRFTGERVWGTAPYPDLASIGGLESLPGYYSGRFLGNSAAAVSALLRGSLFRVNSLGGIGIGSYALATTGRVWLDNVVEPGGRHNAWGLGLLVRSDALDRSASITWAFAENGMRTYLRLGLPF